jgi:hypothetical protein
MNNMTTSAPDPLEEHIALTGHRQPAWATPYHPTVTDLRTELMRSAENWHRLERPYWDQVSASMDRRRTDPNAEPVPSSVAHAQAGLMMASSYAYTLAAVLGIAERQFGPQVARRLAFWADDILTNGDSEDHNADLGLDDPDPTHPDSHAPQPALD